MCAVGFYLNRAFYSDDAYISLRYAYNFITGKGLVWNPGELVEGYTNFLQILFVSCLGMIGVDLVHASRIINAAAFLIMCTMFAAHLRRHSTLSGMGSGKVLFLISITLVMNTFPMISWNFGGLEGPLFTLFCTCGILFFVEYLAKTTTGITLFRSSVCFALASVTRPDGILLYAVSVVFLLWAIRYKAGQRSTPLLQFGLPFICIWLSHMIWRFFYYGEIFPLTYYVKASDFHTFKLKSGLDYVLSYASSPPFVFIMLALALMFAAYRRRFDRRMAYLLTAIVAYLVYVIIIGGDQMYSFRHILPVIPSSILLLYLAIKTPLGNFLERNALLSALCVFFLILLQPFWHGTDARKMSSEDYVGTTVGKYIAANWPQGSLIALNTAGSTPYYAPHHRFIDMLGLNDIHIAKRKTDTIRLRWQMIPGHMKGDGKYVLSRKPDYIIVGPARGTTINRPWFLSDLEMLEDPRFHQSYQVRQIPLSNCLFIYYERVPQPIR